MALKGAKDGLLKQSDPVIPIELELDIDGTGGIFPGNSFHSSYLPQSYMDRVCFQVKGASHKVDSSGWTTTIQGQMRVAGYPEPTGSELRTTIADMDIKPAVDAPPTTKSGPGEYKMDLGNIKNRDGSQATTTLNTTTIESNAVLLDPAGQFLGSSAQLDADPAKVAALKAEQAKLAGQISDMDEYWEVTHLTNVAAELDMAFLEGGKDPTLATGSGFLNWFLETYKTGGSQPKGYNWAGNDSEWIQNALAEYEETLTVPFDWSTQTLVENPFQGGN